MVRTVLVLARDKDGFLRPDHWLRLCGSLKEDLEDRLEKRRRKEELA